MLRLLAALTAAVLLFCACPALGESKPLSISFKGPVTLADGQSASISTKVRSVKEGTVVYSLTDMKRKTVIYTETRTDVKAGQTLSWPVIYDAAGMDAAHPIKKVRASFVLDGKTYSMDLYYNFPTGKNKGTDITIERAEWYSNNTACSFGPAFRDLRPGLTDKWYTFTPIDLTRQGRQTFEYVASNKYVIGEVYVDVKEDSVTVTYRNFYDSKSGNTKTEEEFFTFFRSLASVSRVEPEQLQSQAFSFGVPLSIERDLEGDTSVLLLVCNRVTYCNYVTGEKKLTRFWPNLPERKALRESMLALMDW